MRGTRALKTLSKRDDNEPKKQNFKEKKEKALKTKSFFNAARNEILMEITCLILMDGLRPLKQRPKTRTRVSG